MSFRKSFYLGYPVGFTGFKFTEGCPTGMTKADLPVQEGQWVTFGPLVRGKPFYSGRLFLRRGFWFVSRHHRLSNPRPPVYRAPAFQIPAFEMVATGVMH